MKKTMTNDTQATEEQIKALSTRELLKLKKSCYNAEHEPVCEKVFFRVIAGSVENPKFDETKHVGEGNQKRKNVYQTVSMKREQLFEELNSREHVMNKKEAKVSRRKAAHAKT